MYNLIGSPCFIIEMSNGFIDPTIYLNQPAESKEYRIWMFADPFTAKNFIRDNMGTSVEITVKKHAA